MSIVLLLAMIMAVFGIVGYRRGIWPEVVSLVVLLLAFMLVEREPQRLVSYMNGLFIGLSLVVKSGLSDLSARDLEAAARKLESVRAPFAGERTGLALMIIMIAAAGVGYFLGRWIKGRQSPLGAALGLINGYVLSAAFLPWLSGLSDQDLPVPFIRRGGGLALGPSVAGQVATRLTLPPVLEWLSFEGGLPLVALIAGLAILGVWRMRPKRSPGSRDAR